jgi:cytochrome c-type biogenesis protein CcmH
MLQALRTLRAVAAICALGLWVPTAAPSQITNDSILEERTEEVASVLRCPVCQGLSLNDSPSELSLQMRALVKDQLREGKSPEEIKAYFVSKYGEWVLLEPKAQGMNLVVYLAPFILLLGGGGLIVVMVRKWSAQNAAAPAADSEETEREYESEYE